MPAIFFVPLEVELTVEAFNGRNERGREMFSLVENLLEITPTTSTVCDITFVLTVRTA